jgi:exonuclease SbcC
MRILRIRLKNINSLRGEHFIDFNASPLREAGLFGIVGPMGSGKSTILDSITLALYGSVPRINNGDGEKAKSISKSLLEKGLVLTKYEKECFAEVTYECKNGVFTALWSVSKTRTGSFRDVEMKVFNEAGDQLSDGLKDAPLVNTANIGLDYDQFVKSILLCQGEFAKFLQSGKNDRALLLEKITGTHEFRKIGKKAFKEYNRRKSDLESKTQVIADMARNLLGDDVRAKIEAEIGELTERITVAEKQLDEAKEKLGQKTRLRQLKEKIEEQQKRKRQATLELTEFDEQYGAALQHYEKLYIYKDQLAAHGRLVKSIADADAKISSYSLQIREHDEAIGKLVLELGEWVSEEVSSADYIQHLRLFRDKVRDAVSKRDEKQRALKACYGRLSPLLGLPAFQFEKSLFNPEFGNELLLAKLRGRKDNEANTYKNAIVTYGFGEKELDQLRVPLTDMITDLGQLKVEVRSYKGQAEQVRLNRDRIGTLESKLKEFDMNALRSMLDDAAVVQEKAMQARDQLFAARKLDELRKTLKDGEPCPLCGAEHHPYLHGLAEDVLQAGDAMEKAKLAYDRCKKAYEDGVLQMSQITDGLNRERELLRNGEQEKDRISGLVDVLKKKCGIDKVQSEEKVQELIDMQRNRLQTLDMCIRYQQWEPQAEQLEQAVDEYDGLFSELAMLKGSLGKMYKGTDLEGDCSRREELMTQRQGAKRLAGEQMKLTREQQQTEALQLQGLSLELAASLAAAGYDGVEEACNYLIGEAEQKTLVERKGKITQALMGSEEQLGLMESQWKQAAEGDDPGISQEQQQAAVAGLDAERKEMRDTWKTRHGSLQGDDQLRGQLGQYEEEKKMLLDALRPWEMLNRLIGDATGNKFNTRAQELTLQHLLILANRRMGKLHSRYKLLLPEKMEDDDLRVEDAYMGNEVRTIRTLSGGETFVLSLALALGLSDLASRDIRIDSLFVDEGFGSLDPDTLEEALSTLEQLQTESNKTVGIISHVESLKERIYTQIRLTKSNSGFSTLSIFPEAGSTDEAQ